jgi:peptide/nickel transport system substrate-binding protein
MSNAIKYWNEGAAAYTYNPERAKQLVQESGWDLSKKIRLYVPSGNTNNERVCLILAEGFKAIGLNIVEERIDGVTAISKVQGKTDYDLGIVGVPERPLVPILGIHRVASKTGSWTNFTTPRLDTLVDIINTSVDEDEIEKAYLEFQNIVVENVPASGLYAARSLNAVNKRVIYGELKERGPLLDVEKWDVQ